MSAEGSFDPRRLWTVTARVKSWRARRPRHPKPLFKEYSRYAATPEDAADLVRRLPSTLAVVAIAPADPLPVRREGGEG